MKTSVCLALVCTVALVGLKPSTAQASIETDRNVGKCVAYLILLQRPKAAQIALAQADNQERALQFVGTQLAQIERFVDAGRWNSTMEKGFAVGGERACRQVGIRPGDFDS